MTYVYRNRVSLEQRVPNYLTTFRVVNGELSESDQAAANSVFRLKKPETAKIEPVNLGENDVAE